MTAPGGGGRTAAEGGRAAPVPRHVTPPELLKPNAVLVLLPPPVQSMPAAVSRCEIPALGPPFHLLAGAEHPVALGVLLPHALLPLPLRRRVGRAAILGIAQMVFPQVDELALEILI